MKIKKKQIIIITIITVILIICGGLTAYFNIIEVKSVPTKQIQETCNIETEEYMERQVFVVTSQSNKDNGKKIIYLHGGSYFAEMTKNHWTLMEKLAKDTGATIIIPDYPLAPKHNCQEVFDFIEPLYKEITKQVNSEDLILMGDSAGGGMALALLEKLDHNTIDIPAKTILISPWLDVTMSNEKIQEKVPFDSMLNPGTLIEAGKIYADKLETTNYLVSPIYGDVTKLKNVTILTGTYDILNPDVYKLQEMIEEKEGTIKVNTYEDVDHEWIIGHINDEEYIKQGYDDLVDEINT